jgi:hypothetical protein
VVESVLRPGGRDGRREKEEEEEEECNIPGIEPRGLFRSGPVFSEAEIAVLVRGGRWAHALDEALLQHRHRVPLLLFLVLLLS